MFIELENETGMTVNAEATFVTYYVSGEMRALALDLMIRSATSGAKSLDDVLRSLRRRSWDAPNASYYLQGRGYTEADVEAAASEVYGRDLHDWFERYVGGTEDLPWSDILAGAAQLSEIVLRFATQLANATGVPTWNRDAEFRAVRPAPLP